MLGLLAALTTGRIALAAAPEILTATLAADRGDAAPGSTIGLSVELRIAHGWHAYPPHPSTKDLEPIDIKLEGPPGTTFAPLAWPPGREATISAFDRSIPLYEGTVTIKTSARLPDSPLAGPTIGLTATVHYQACSDTQCRIPTDVSATVSLKAAPAVPAPAATPGPTVAPAPPSTVAPSAGSAPAPSPAQAPASVTGPAATPPPPATPAPAPEGQITEWLARYGLAPTLFLIFLGGLALNLTPCVYPMIPITISFFGGQAAGKTRVGLLLPLLYLLGMSVTYTVMGVAAALMGELFGGALQSTAVVVCIAAVFVLLALSMFGLYELEPPAFIADRAGAREGAVGAFLMGLLVGFLAAPCIGPFVTGLLLVVAQKGSVWFGFVTFFSLSLGLGTPYVILGASTGALTRLPTAGAWMESVRRFFGVVLLLMALHYLRGPLGSPVVTGLAGVILIAAGVFAGAIEPIRNNDEGPTPWGPGLWKSAGLVSLTVGACLVWSSLAPPAPEHGAASPPGIAWTTDDAVLDRPAGLRGPVMIDFFSDVWCPACKELAQETFPAPEVVAESRRFTNLKVDVDTHPRRKELMKRYEIKGIPAILFLGSDGQEVSSARISGFVPSNELVRHMRMVK